MGKGMVNYEIINETETKSGKSKSNSYSASMPSENVITMNNRAIKRLQKKNPDLITISSRFVVEFGGCFRLLHSVRIHKMSGIIGWHATLHFILFRLLICVIFRFPEDSINASSSRIDFEIQRSLEFFTINFMAFQKLKKKKSNLSE